MTGILALPGWFNPWGWTALAVVAIILLIVIIVLIARSGKKDKKAAKTKASEPEAAPARAESVKEEKREEPKPEPKPAQKTSTAPKSAPKTAAKPAPKSAPKEEPAKTYHIAKRKEDGRWQVKAAGASKALKLFLTQQEAIDFAKKTAENQDARIVIHKEDGTFRRLSYTKK